MFRTLLLIALIGLLPLLGWCLPDDKQQLLYINADEIKIDERNKHDIYSGNVHLVQGSTHITGNKMHVFRDAHGKLVRIRMLGERAHYTTLPKVGDMPFEAWGLAIVYHVTQAHVVLFEKAQVKQQITCFKEKD